MLTHAVNNNRDEVAITSNSSTLGYYMDQCYGPSPRKYSTYYSQIGSLRIMTAITSFPILAERVMISSVHLYIFEEHFYIIYWRV